MINWMRQRNLPAALICRQAGIWGMVAVAVVVIIIWAYSISDAQDAPKDKPLKIGVINMVEVFNKSKKREQFTVVLEKEKQEEELRIKQMENQIKEWEKEMKAMDPASELRQARGMDIRILSMRLENQVKKWNKRINKKVNEQTAFLYNEIRSAIDKYARENGFTLILKSDPPLEKESDESATLRINVRAVLYYDNTIDLTEKIIKVLNK